MHVQSFYDILEKFPSHQGTQILVGLDSLYNNNNNYYYLDWVSKNRVRVVLEKENKKKGDYLGRMHQCWLHLHLTFFNDIITHFLHQPTI